MVQSLSWMGRTPDSQPENGAWRLNEANYYHQGWLASGNTRGVIGITFTACLAKSIDPPPRTNFYLRGHRSEVILVKWNEPYQKLATCDITGIIFVWIKHDGRWSIELINDRSSQVTDFCWSHDGQMALICYKDSFVLVGSVAGQRYWSSMLNLDGCMVTCGIWTPDDQRVMFGTTAGKVIVMSASGTMVAQVIIHEGLEISCLGWSSERFHLVEQESSDVNISSDLPSSRVVKPYILSVVLSVGDVLLMSSYDDVCPKVIHTGLSGVKVEWSNDGELLAVCGYVRQLNQDCCNEVRFYRRSSRLQFILQLPTQGKQPVTAMTWGHNDKRVFVAVGAEIFTIRVIKHVASLQLLCQRCVRKQLPDEKTVSVLPLPTKLQGIVAELFCPTIKGYIPYPGRLREFVCAPPPWKDRLHCTIIRHGDETSGGYYTLYLEHLGGLIPLLKGRRASKLHPDFVIFDPQDKVTHRADEENVLANSDSLLEDSDSDGNARDGCGSPSARRKKRFRKLRDSLKCRESAPADQQAEEVAYDDSLPESSHLVSITSNIWGTKFRFSGLATFLPNELGSVTYKTSLLHLQPRQMTVGIVELSNDPHSQLNDIDFSAGNLSESEDELYGVGCELDTGNDNSNIIAAPSSNNHAAIGAMAVGLDGGGGIGACGMDNIEGGLMFEYCNSPANKSKHQRSSRLTSPQKTATPDNSPKVRHLAGSLSPLLTGRVPTGLHQNILTSAQAERLTRVSPTEVDHPYIECLLNDRRLNNASGQCFRLSSGPRELSHSPVAPPGDGCTARAVDDGPLLPSIFLRSVLNGANGSSTGASRVIAQQPDADDQCSKQNECGRSCDAGRPTAKNTVTTLPSSDPLPRWADKACHDIQFIDDFDEKSDLYERQCSSRDAVHCTAGSGLSAREIMQSTQMLANVANPPKTVCLEPELRLSVSANAATVGAGVDAKRRQELGVCLDAEECAAVDISCDVAQCDLQPANLAQHRSDFISGSESHSMVIADVPSICSFEPHKTRLVLTNSPETKPKSMSKLREMARNALCSNRSRDMLRGKRRGLCAIANPVVQSGGGGGGGVDDNFIKSSDSSNPNSPILPPKVRQQRCGSLDARHYSTLDGVADSLAPPSLTAQSTSLPASPVHRLGGGGGGGGGGGKKQNKQMAGRSKLQSPLTRRRLKKNSAKNPGDSSDDEHTMSAEEVTTSENYRNLETFQKAQLNKKLRKVRTKFDSELVLETNSSHTSPHGSPQHAARSVGGSPTKRPKRRHFVMYNKAPMWNESSQVYQLDFGGRVTQESAKNFQIEFGGKQVMQFGRIDNNAYTLDFQYPYSAIQAFAVALANVTQRLK